MPSRGNSRSLLIIASVFSFVALATAIVSVFAQGYRINIRPNGLPSIKATGLLSLTSIPKGAAVYLNNQLTTATDDTLNLPPSDYDLKIIKDGFLPWQKTIRIQKEIVYQADIVLFRSAPDLKPITTSGAVNPTVSPDNSKIIFAVASASATKNNGLYLVELTTSPITLGKNTPRQISPNFPGINWSQATFTFSPDSRQVLATFNQSGIVYLLDLSQNINRQNLYDVSHSLKIIEKEWQTAEQGLILSKVDRLPRQLQSLVSTQSAQHLNFSSTDSKALYLAAADGQLPENIIPLLPGRNSQPQTRFIQQGKLYVYDLIQDTNYLIGDPTLYPQLNWLPHSDNLIFIKDKDIGTIEYDNTNPHTLFTDNTSPQTICFSPDGSRIVTLTSPFPGASQNLYAITIRN